jgi:nitrous oxidase accessory protein
MKRWPLIAVALTTTVGASPPQGADEMDSPGARLGTNAFELAPRPTRPALPGLPWFQRLVDAAKPGDVLRPPPGRYSGPVVVSVPLTIEGADVIIDGGGSGHVFTLQTSGATLRGLTFTGSGGSHSDDDACLDVRGSYNVIDGNRFEDCLFGIDLKQSNKNTLTRNHIRSKPLPLGLRGDAMRLWYSNGNLVEENHIADSRDLVVWYSNDNVIRKNDSTRSRYSLHFMYAHENTVEDNHFTGNSVGINVMYTEGMTIRRNFVEASSGSTGIGIGFKEASETIVEDNAILYCAVGINSDMSPFQPDTTITIRRNRLAYNGVGLTVVGDKPGTLVEQNVFEGNIEQVAQSGGGSAMHLTFKDNYWDDYQGFDRNGDGRGDTPYELYAYADRIWMEAPTARFFKNAPLMEAIDFLERLAPFSSPTLLVRDDSPRFRRPQGLR